MTIFNHSIRSLQAIVIASISLTATLLGSADGSADDISYRVPYERAGVFFVEVDKSVTTADRTQLIFIARSLCRERPECKVYMWNDPERVPKSPPVTNQNLPLLGTYTAPTKRRAWEFRSGGP